MRIVLQRVSSASVTIENEVRGRIGHGLVVLIGIEAADEKADADWLLGKLTNMRIFEDGEGKMNLSLQDVKGDLLVVSQFTLHASTRKGNRPSFMRAAPPQQAEALYNYFVNEARQTGLKVETGIFAAHMHIALVNDGPVTITMDSKMKE